MSSWPKWKHCLGRSMLRMIVKVAAYAWVSDCMTNLYTKLEVFRKKDSQKA